MSQADRAGRFENRGTRIENGPAPDMTFAVRVRPGASRTAVGGSYDGSFGPAIVVAVPEPAVDGRANVAVLAALTKALGLGRRQATVRIGERGRDKLISVTDPPADLTERLRALGSLR